MQNGQLKIVSWNVNAWTKDNGANRANILNSLDPDIILLQETKLTDDSIIELPGFIFYGHNRSFCKNTAKCGSGGVAILIKSLLKCDYHVTIADKSHDGIIIVKLIHKANTQQIAVASVYLPPEASEYGKNGEAFFNHLLNQSYILSDVDIFILGGDLNARINADSDYIQGVDAIPKRILLDEGKNKHGASFVDFLIESKMCIINGRLNAAMDDFTSLSKKGKSVVDYFFCPHENLSDVINFEVKRISNIINELNILPGKLPDHSILLCEIKTTFTMAAVTNGPNCKKLTNSGFGYKRNVPDNFFNENVMALVNETIYKIENGNEINHLYDEICKAYYMEIDNKLSKKHNFRQGKKRSGKPWWNEELERMWTEVSQAESEFAKAKGRPRQRLYLLFKDKRNQFDRKYNQCKRLFNRIERDNLSHLNTDNPKAFWDKIKRMGPQKDDRIPMEIPADEDIITDPEQVLLKWKNDFQLLYNRLDVENVNEDFLNEVKLFKETFERENPVNDPISNSYVYNSEITLDEVQKVMSKAKNNKAVGIDTLPNEVFKNENSILLWHKFFNRCFKTGIVPDIWSKALIKPIPKGGSTDRRIPLNYRGISLLPTISKVYSSVLNERLLSYLENNSLLTDTQNGFRKLRSCVDHLYVLTSIIRNRKVKGLSTFVCYIDLEKAFDMVDRTSLFVKLGKAGIKGNLYWAIHSLYVNHMSSVLVNEYQTDWFCNMTGVKQGDNLSTTLFALYLNDLAEEIQNSGNGITLEDDLSVSLLMYADDIALIAENEENLQNMLNIVHQWSKKWKMSLNTEKSKIVHYRKKSSHMSDFNFKYGDKTLSYCNEYKYLGCTLSEHLDYTDTANILSQASSRALGSILCKYKQLKGLNYDIYTKLYNTCICTIMDYSSAIWGFKQYDKCDTVHNRAMRAFLGVHRFTSVPGMSGDMVWQTPKHRRHIEILRLWLRFVQMDDHRLTKKVFMWDKKAGKGSWFSDLKSILKECNLEHLLCDDPLSIMGTSDIVKTARTKLESKQVSSWETDVEKQRKLRFYRLFKTDFKVEPFVTINLPTSHRSLLAQLRYGVLPLKLETGRFINLPINERKCIFCDEQVVETEIHFLFECNLYTTLRTKFYAEMEADSKNFSTFSIEDKLNVLFSKSNIIRRFAVYLDSCFRKRSSVLYK